MELISAHTSVTIMMVYNTISVKINVFTCLATSPPITKRDGLSSLMQKNYREPNNYYSGLVTHTVI